MKLWELWLPFCLAVRFFAPSTRDAVAAPTPKWEMREVMRLNLLLAWKQQRLYLANQIGPRYSAYSIQHIQNRLQKIEDRAETEVRTTLPRVDP